MTREQKFGIGLLALIAFLLWWLSKKGLIHESVTSTVLAGSAKILPNDALTGAPTFDANSVPDNEEAAIPPIDGDGTARFDVKYPQRASCPIGYQLWKNLVNGTYECIPK